MAVCRSASDSNEGRPVIIRLSAIIVALCLASPTHAADVNSGNFMLPYCKQWVESERMSDRFSGICAGTIATLAWNASALEYPWRFCAPDGVTNGQLGRVVISHLEKHPEKLH